MNNDWTQGLGLAGELASLPVRNQVIFPGTRQTLHVGRPKSIALVEAMQGVDPPLIALFEQLDVDTEDPGHADLHAVGVVVRVLEGKHYEGLGFALVAEALGRVRRSALIQEEPYLLASIEPIIEGPISSATQKAAAALCARAAEVMPALGSDLEAMTSGDSPGRLSDLIGDRFHSTGELKSTLLGTLDIEQRLELACQLVDHQHALQSRVASLELDLSQPWPLEPGAEERIAESVAKGVMTELEAQSIRDFIEKGYVIWEGLIEPELIDELVRDVRGIRDHPGRFVTTDNRRGRPFRLSGPDFDHFENIFDVYVNYESARRACFHPTLLRFMELIFDTKPVAVQQLLFQRSNIHPLHQDSAFVCGREPLQMVATWIALEDVVRGRGELTYYEGSHRIPHYLYQDGTKRFNAEIDDAEAAQREMLKHCEAMGCEKRDFIAKKGDVFLWAADLLHGSNPRTRSEEETRMSCVTHYCPQSSEPLWLWLNPEHDAQRSYDERGLIMSSHYKLSDDEGFLRPVPRIPEPC